MQKYQILWADDEIELLKPHIIFLNAKGYEVTPVNNGLDAIDACKDNHFDIVFLDENMPGMSGLEVLAQVKASLPNLPVVMITKSEEEYIMEEAIGAKISDYLIKPLNPNQILLSVKKILDNKRLVTEKTNMGYQQDFQNLSMKFNDILNYEEWSDVYKKLIYWELEIDQTEHKSMKEVLEMQKTEANSNFCRFIEDSYVDWLEDKEDAPLMSHQLIEERVLPLLEEDNKPVFFIVIDNLRFDQWKTIEPEISEYFKIEEDNYFSILPTTTSYARNAIFSGLLPAQMAKMEKDIWVNDGEEGGLNKHEDEFLRRQLKRLRKDYSTSYHKIFSNEQGRELNTKIKNLLSTDLNAIVYNFVDMLSHARSDMQVIKELAGDEAAYRSITLSWFKHSPLLELLMKLSELDVNVVLTTDHGTIRVKNPVKIVGDRSTNTNLRYKMGKNLSYNEKDVLEARSPEKFHLPKVNLSTSFAFCKDADYFVYPNNYNHFVNLYKDTFQHGGVSLEEVIVPLVTLKNKR